MGQYHKVFNLDKREFLAPHDMGDGAKLMEFGQSTGGTMTGLAVLLATSNGRGGGDFRPANEADSTDIVGRWAGDRIAICGDYGEDTDKCNLYDAEGYENISAMVYGALQRAGEI